MKLAILFTTVFNFLTAGAPNLCDDVYLDSTGAPYTDSIGQTLARYCKWTGPDAPVWDADVCCTIGSTAATCRQSDGKGRCRTGFKMYCEYGQLMTTGEVVCMQPLPDACEEGFCIQAPSTSPPVQEGYAGCCAEGGGCQLVVTGTAFDCDHGYWVSCSQGSVDEDGTLECYG